MLKINKKISLILLLTIFIFSASSAWASDISEQKVIELVNKSRNQTGLSALMENQKLDYIANLKAQDMLDNQYFAHTSPQGKTPWDWFLLADYDYKYAGENLAIDFVSAEDQHEAWMKSQSHRSNILNSKFSEIGVAVATGKIDKKDSIITVQVFALPTTALGSQEKFFYKDDKINLDELSKGVVLASKFDSGSSNSFWHKTKNLFEFNSQGVADFLWVLVLISAFSVLIISPLRLVERSYEEMFASSSKKLKTSLTKLLGKKGTLEEFEKSNSIKLKL